MPCTCPMDAYPARPDSADQSLVWSPHSSYAGARPIRLPCGQCLGCRLDRSQGWATRIVHEAQFHEHSVFVTPTFSDEFLPADLSVSVRTHQLFVKRVRYFFEKPLRFFGVGEYGGKTNRPHYHTIFFGLELPDRTLWRTTPAGDRLYRSVSFERAWPYGHCLIGEVTPQSAAYVARYCTKKMTGEASASAYRRTSFDPATGEIRAWQVRSEFAVMSRRPGIGSEWFEKFSGDAFPSDFVVIDGQKRAVPAFYKKRLAEAAAAEVTLKRKVNARRHAANNTEARLMTRHESQRLRAERLERSLENEE